MSNPTAMIEELTETPDRLEALTRGALDAALDHAAEGEWSTRTVLAHLRDDEFMVMRLRLVRLLTEEEPLLAPFNETAWEANRWRRRDSLDELLADFQMQREASLMVLERVSGADYERRGTQPEIGELTVRSWIDHWVEHDETHVAQIESTLAAAA